MNAAKSSQEPKLKHQKHQFYQWKNNNMSNTKSTLSINCLITRITSDKIIYTLIGIEDKEEDLIASKPAEKLKSKTIKLTSITKNLLKDLLRTAVLTKRNHIKKLIIRNLNLTLMKIGKTSVSTSLVIVKVFQNKVSWAHRSSWKRTTLMHPAQMLHLSSLQIKLVVKTYLFQHSNM